MFASRIGIGAAPGSAPTVTPGFAPVFGSIFSLPLAPDVEVIAAGDGFGAGPGRELDMEVASAAPKLEGAHGADANDGCGVVAEAAGVAAGMGIASTGIAVPRVRLHSTRQWRGIPRRQGRGLAMVAISETYRNAPGDDEDSKTEWKTDGGKSCRAQPGKIRPSRGAVQGCDSIAMMPALQQIGGIELLLLAA
jgi:hypothetical protein